MTFSLHRSTRWCVSILLIPFVLFQARPQGATGTIMPTPFQTVLDTNGNPVSGAKICTYLAGTTTPTATYTDSALLVPNSNPIVADSAGRFTAYLSPGASYKFIYQDATGTAGTCNGVVLKTVDNVFAVPAAAVNLDLTVTAGEALTAGQAAYVSDGSGGKTTGQAYKADAANGYSSSTAVLVGMIPSSIALGAQGTLRVEGQMTGLSVVTGSTYYVGTAGAITSTPPTNSRRLGIADTTSSLLLNGSSGFTNPITQDLLFTDATYDIGKVGATRPRDVFLSRNLTAGGLITVNGFGSHLFSAGGVGANTLHVINPTAGTGNYAEVSAGADQGPDDITIRMLSSTFATSGFNVASGGLLKAQQAGGLSIAASHASGAIRFYSGGSTLQGNVTTGGAWQNNAGGSWATISDRRLKTAIEPWTDVTLLRGLRPRQFDWINPSAHGGITHAVGFIAQEVAAIAPLWVREDGTPQGADATLIDGPSYTVQLPIGFDALIVAGWQDHDARVAALEAENAALKRRLDALERRFNQ